MNRASIRQAINAYVELPVARGLARLGVSPNAVTFAGLAGAGISAYLISEGLFWAGGVVMLLAGVLDLFDGALARATGQDSDFGALLDSVIDRVSEIVVLLGLLLFYARNGSVEGSVLVYLAAGGVYNGELPAGAVGGAGDRVQGGDNDAAGAGGGTGVRADYRALAAECGVGRAGGNRGADDTDYGRSGCFIHGGRSSGRIDGRQGPRYKSAGVCATMDGDSLAICFAGNADAIARARLTFAAQSRCYL